MKLTDLANEAKAIIARAEAAGVTIDDGNVVDLIADNAPASLSDIRAALVVAGMAYRFPQATAKERARVIEGREYFKCE